MGHGLIAANSNTVEMERRHDVKRRDVSPESERRLGETDRRPSVKGTDAPDEFLARTGYDGQNRSVPGTAVKRSDDNCGCAPESLMVRGVSPRRPSELEPLSSARTALVAPGGHANRIGRGINGQA